LSSWFASSGILQDVKESAEALGARVYIVGGCVRDRLLGRESHDMDFAVDGSAMTLARMVADRTRGAYFPLDEERDTARVLHKVGSRTYYLDFARLRARDLDADLKLRDYTVNAIGVALEDWEEQSPSWIDPAGGRRDLEEGLIRATTPKALVDDPLRALRAVRLVGRLSFHLDPTTESLIRRDAHLLATVSTERVRDELSLMLETWPVYAQVLDLDRLGLLTVVFPELIPLREVEQGPWHVWDVYQHSLRVIQGLDALYDANAMLALVRQKGILEPWLAVREPFLADIDAHLNEELSTGRTRRVLLRLAALLHDVAKPDLRTEDESGRVRFHGHDKAGAPIVGTILRRLHFSAREVKEGQTIVEHHMRPGLLTRDKKVSRRAAYRFFRDTGEAAISILLLSLADYLATKGRSIEAEQWTEHLFTIRRLLTLYYREPETVNPPRLVTGDDLMRELDITSGPQIGRLLEAIREAQAVGEVRSRKEALTLARRLLTGEGRQGTS